MVSTAAATGMALLELGMALIPGPNMIYLVSRSLSQGWRAGMMSLVGTFVGFVVYMTMANVGLAAVFLVVPWLYTGVKLAGAAYLIYLAWKNLKPGGQSVFESRKLQHDSRAKLFRKGLLTNLLNPKTALMYLALIPQFIRPDAGSVIVQGFILGGVQITVGTLVNTVVVLAAGGVAVFLRTRPRWMKWQRWITGTALGLVGIKLALDSPSPAAG